MKFDLDIPDDVNLKNIGKLCTFTQGVQIPASETYREMKEGLIRYIYIRDLFSDDYPQYIQDKHPQKILSPSDIVMVNTGATAGNVYRGKYGVLCNNAFRIKIKESALSHLDQEFLWYYLNSHIKKRYLNMLFNTAGQPHVGHSNVAQLLIPLFPLPEQRKIAEILSTWDEAIQLVEALITALKTRKRGLMQLLLTGEVRFPGFNEPWEELQVDELGEIFSGGTPDTNNPDYWGGDIAWVTPTEITALSTKYIDGTRRTITNAGLKASSARIIQPHSIILCTRATIGDAAINLIPMATNQGFKNLTLKDGHNTEFFYYLITQNKHQLKRLANGSTFLELSKGDFGHIRFLVPKPDEQTTIAETINQFDVYIEGSHEYINYLREQKKGLMQRLLTGEVRVSV